jgi:hypothetical protein
VASSITPESFIEPGRLLARLDELCAVFEADYERVAEVYELMLGEEVAAYGTRAAAVFSRWEEEGGGPTLPAMLAHAFEYFDLDPHSVGAKAVMISGIIAEMPNTLQYHGNEHYRKVLFHAIRLLATQNAILRAGNSPHVLETDQIVTALAGSCIHDLGHHGGDNLLDGVYTPGFMEQEAFNIARPYYEALGLSRDIIGEIETIVFCTDITFFAGDNSPGLRMKKIYKHYFWGDDSEDVSMMMMGKLRRYEDNPRLVLMGMILHEADVGTSAGLSYEHTIKETINIIEERGFKTAGPKTVLAFLREQLGETMFTEAGKQIFGPVMAIVIDQAQQDILRGRQTFYED